MAIPVLPAVFVESAGGQRLAEFYDGIVASIPSSSSQRLVESFTGLMELIVPAVAFAHEWNLQEAQLLAFGLVLVPRSAAPGGLCRSCGYALEGLKAVLCPGCGQPIS